MRSQFLTLVLNVAFCVAFSASAFAQPTWRFHLALENGDGARDTIWLVFDAQATLPVDPFPGPNVDTLLGEAGLALDPDVFNVFVRNALWDSTKTFAKPYSWYPIFDGPLIESFNWVAPITIRWDTSLFHAPYLPGPDTFGVAMMGGSYFFGHNNHPELQAFDMLLADSVVVDADAFMLFPFGVYFGVNNGISVQERTNLHGPILVPNPTAGPLRVLAPEALLRVCVFDGLGRVVYLKERSAELDLSHLPDGVYTLRIVTANNHTYHAQLVKDNRR